MVIICPASRHMTANVFVDTNVFIYAVDEGDLEKQRAAHSWRAWLWQTNRGRISFQVLQEFYVIATKKQPFARAEIRRE
jgi:predicted nucleic acid-binding protein